MRYRKLCLILLLGLLLCGCGQETPETIPSAPPPTSLPAETIPPTTVPPTEPEVILEAGLPVFADGDELAGGSVIYEDRIFVPIQAFLEALDHAQWSGDEENGYCLERLGRNFQFHRDNGFLIDGVPAPEVELLRYQGQIWIPIEEICEALSISLFFDDAGSQYFCTSVGTGWDWERGVKIPILMYHGVSDNTHGAAELFVRPADLEEQICWLLENGYDLITFEDWMHLEDFDKPVMLTFDDGYRDNYEELFPILKKYNVKATVFVITGSVDIHDTTLSYMQVREMAQSGLVSMQSHTYTHPHLDECSEEKLHHELLTSKLMLTRMTRYEPFVLCYPYGDRSELTVQVAQGYYRFGLDMNGGLCTTGDEVYQIPRFYVSRYTTMSEFQAMVSGSGR